MNTIRIKFDKHYTSTANAYLVSVGGKEMWLPKKLCRNFITNKKLAGNVVIPEWLYREKFGCEPSEDMYETVIVHHTPLIRESVISNEIKELKKSHE